MENVHYTVSGLASSESKTKVKNALDEMNGVQQVAVDLARGTVEVTFNPPATEHTIKQCIEHAGYTIE